MDRSAHAGHSTSDDELSKAKYEELQQAKARLGKARATATEAEIDIKVGQHTAQIGCRV